ncbi:MAG: hypothetical protein ABI270_11720 [Nitrosospira sp.]
MLFVRWVEKYKTALAGDGIGEWESRDDGDAAGTFPEKGVVM